MTQSVQDKLRSYLRRGMFNVPGFMHPVDAAAQTAILLHQRDENLAGSVAEIGINHGRSFFLLAQTLRPDEHCLACDLFDNDGQLDSFSRRAQRLGIHVDHLAVGPSQRLRPADVLKAVGYVRFFSIDGGHMLADVCSDFLLASAVLAQHGVIALDDFCNPNWPEVSAAVFECLRDGAYLPFAVTDAKLYVCRAAFHERYLAMMRSSAWLRGFAQHDITMLGAHLMFFHHPPRQRLLFEALARLGLGSVAIALQQRPLAIHRQRHDRPDSADADDGTRSDEMVA